MVDISGTPGTRVGSRPSLNHQGNCIRGSFLDIEATLSDVLNDGLVIEDCTG